MITPVALALAALAAASPAAGGKAYAVNAAESTLRYAVVHKLHEVEGVSTRVEGKAVVQADGRVLAMVRAPVGSFVSGDANRDTHMQEVLETQRFPHVVFKGIAQLPGGPRLASAAGVPVEVSMTGEVDLHGVKAQVTVPVKLDLRPDGSVRARGTFTVSLEAHRVQRPALLFIKVDDACRIALDLVLKEVSP